MRRKNRVFVSLWQSLFCCVIFSFIILHILPDYNKLPASNMELYMCISQSAFFFAYCGATDAHRKSAALLQFPPTYATIQSPPDQGYNTSARSGGVLFDHNSDHRRLRSTRNQWRQKVPKAFFPEQKGSKTTQKHRKKRILSLWDQDRAGSIPVTPMKSRFDCFFAFKPAQIKYVTGSCVP